MNKCTCASIISLYKLNLCSRQDVQCRVQSPCKSLVCTFMPTNFTCRWLFVNEMEYDLKEAQIKLSLDVSVIVFCFL